MSTLNKATADNLVANDGWYDGDRDSTRCYKIVKYTNAWGGESYGCIFEGQHPDVYRESEFVREPITYWFAKVPLKMLEPK